VRGSAPHKNLSPGLSYRTPLGCGLREAVPHKNLSPSPSRCRSRSHPSCHRRQGRSAGRRGRGVGRRSRRGTLECAQTAPPCARPSALTRGRSLRERRLRPPLLPRQDTPSQDSEHPIVQDFASPQFSYAICQYHGPLIFGAIGQCQFVFLRTN
jgi:hypothetical protein